MQKPSLLRTPYVPLARMHLVTHPPATTLSFGTAAQLQQQQQPALLASRYRLQLMLYAGVESDCRFKRARHGIHEYAGGQNPRNPVSLVGNACRHTASLQVRDLDSGELIQCWK